MIIFGRFVGHWLERQVSNRKVAGSMPVLGINANYLKGILSVFLFFNFSFAFF